MVIKVIIDHKKCVGCATCSIIAPEIFSLDKDGFSVLKPKFREDSNPYIGFIPEELRSKAIKAKNSCLGSAIDIVIK